jgi:hypothetical protein
MTVEVDLAGVVRVLGETIWTAAVIAIFVMIVIELVEKMVAAVMVAVVRPRLTPVTHLVGPVLPAATQRDAVNLR